jgi:hypothetical protein
MHQAHAEAMLKGSFRFGRMRYYQMLEVVFDDDSIGDVEEGLSSATVSVTINEENSNSPIVKNLANFIKVSGTSQVELENATFIHQTDCYICCWSTTKSPDLSGAGSSYDTCVTSSGAKSLAHYLSRFGVERESGLPLTELFGRIAAGRVHYHDSTHDLSNNPLPNGNPFRKRKKYQNQSEYRIVLFPKQPLNLDFVMIDCSSASSLLSAESITLKTAVKSQNSPRGQS